MSDTKSPLKIVLAILIVTDVLIFGGWYAMWSQVPPGSRSWFYQTSYYAESGEKDDFGDAKPAEEVKKFTPGLIDMALPASFAVTAASVGYLILARRKAQKQA